MMSDRSVRGRTPPQPLPTRGRDLTRPHPRRFVQASTMPHGFSPLVGEMAGRPEGEGRRTPPVTGEERMAHSNIEAKTRQRAKTLRREMTKAERIMWDILRDFRPRGARFRRETPIGPYIADFSWLSARIVVEVDGDSHETTTGRRHDTKRDAFLKSNGFTVMRFDNSQIIDNPDYVAVSMNDAISLFLDGGPQ